MTERPALTTDLDEDEFRRWYFTMAELQPFARMLGVSASGPKAELTARIADRLAGREVARAVTRTRSPQLTGDLDHATRIPVGQRSTQHLRAFFEREIGPAFTFDGHMRSFLAAGGATLGDAVDHWHRTRGQPLPPQSESLEYNRFVRAWHEANPDGDAAACRAAWQHHRSLPVDERPPLTST